MKKSGFTLIELLIVVAIIAILAAIAVPNFLEAQTRAKVSRTTADMRTLATGLELYRVDHNKPMTCRTGWPGQPLTGPSLVNSAATGVGWVSYRFRRLTTPIAYITTVFPDVFVKSGVTKDINGNPSINYDSFDYFEEFFDDRSTNKSWRGAALTSGASWRVVSCGPDNIQGQGGSYVGNAINKFGMDYDATNGTVSRGDIVRISSGAGAKNPASLVGPNPGIDRIENKYYDPAL